MAESDNVLTKLHDLLVYLVPQLSRFPRDQKFVLGDRIEVKVLEVQESCLRAYYGRDKRPHLLEANLTLEVTRHLIRLAHALRYFSNHTYGVVSEKVDVVGRMIGGWLRAERGHSCPMPLGIEGVEPLPNAVWPLSGRDFNAGTTAIRLPSPRRDDRSRQLRRSGMFIAREPNQDPRKPQRGGMVARGGRHAAPTELEEIRGGGGCYKHAAPTELGLGRTEGLLPFRQPIRV